MSKYQQLPAITRASVVAVLCSILSTVAQAQDESGQYASSHPYGYAAEVASSPAGGREGLINRRFHVLQLNIAVANHRSLDRLASPLIYRGTLGGLELNYQYQAARHRHSIAAGLAGGDLASSVSHFSGVGSTLWLEYDYARRALSRNSDRVQMFLGGEVRAHGSVFETTEILKENVSWLSMYTVLGFTASAESEFGQGTVSFWIGIPLAGLVSRPPYATYDDALLGILDKPIIVLTSGGGFYSIGQFFFLDQRLSYTYRFTSHLGILAGYRFGLYRFKEPRPIHQLTNSIHFGIRFEI